MAARVTKAHGDDGATRHVRRGAQRDAGYSQDAGHVHFAPSRAEIAIEMAAHDRPTERKAYREIRANGGKKTKYKQV